MAPRLSILGQVVVVAAIAAFWEYGPRLGWVDSYLVPPLSEVLETLFVLLGRSSFLGHLGMTVGEVAVAFLFVGPLGILLGFAIGENANLTRSLMPTINLLMAVPKSILLPLFILAFGIGFGQKVAFGVTLGILFVIVAAIAAVQSVPAGLVNAARAFGASRGQIFTRIYFPAMTPLLIEGLRLGLIFTITGVLLAEMYGAPKGLGRAIFAWAESYQLPELYAAVLLILVGTITLNELLEACERFARSRLQIRR